MTLFSRLNSSSKRLEAQLSRWPASITQLLARFTLATVFWQAGQSKIEGFALNPLTGQFQLGWPQISESTLYLFSYEYQLPLISPLFAAYLATIAEHLFAPLLLLGLFTRLSALALLIMTIVIQIFVYPEAYVTHGLWATGLLLLMAQGAGRFSLDQLWRR